MAAASGCSKLAATDEATMLAYGVPSDERHARSTSTSLGDSKQATRPTPVISARTLALYLLRLSQCAGCNQPVCEPVTLPCGHSSCLACIVQGTSNAIQALPRSSYRPPRLPMSTTTVPCPLPDCARHAIGRGLGLWAGHQAVYGDLHGPQDGMTEKIPHERQASASPVAGQLPVDGFVVPTHASSNGLTVIAAQRHASFSTRYAISSFGAQGKLIEDEKATLRSDVTLNKAVGLLRRFAGVAPTWPKSQRPRRDLFPAHGNISNRRRGGSSPHVRNLDRPLRRFIGPSTSSATTHSLADDATHHPPGTRTEIDERFLGVMGISEAAIESCTVGGISAVLSEASDEDLDEADDAAHSEDGDGAELSLFEDGHRQSDGGDKGLRFDDDTGGGDDEIGGAFARPSALPRRGKRARRHTLQQQNLRTTVTGSALRGAQVDPSTAWMTVDECIAQSVRDDQASTTFTTPEERQEEIDRLHEEMMDVLECQLCYMLLIQPLTTPCGHTFCRRCFARSLDHSSSCPLCRADMPSFSFFQEHAANRIMYNLLTADISTMDQLAVGQESKKTTSDATNLGIAWTLKHLHDERKLAIEKEERESLLSTPLFVCTLGFPYMPTILHIFEPRYRLMIRRCLESGHPRFGMVMHSQNMSSTTPGMSPYGTMLEIKTVKMLPDGRSMIETMGSYRFKVLQKGSLDGYVVGQIEQIEDVPLEAEYELEQASIGNLNLWESSPGSSSSGSSGDDVEQTLIDAASGRSASASSSSSSRTPNEASAASPPPIRTNISSSSSSSDTQSSAPHYVRHSHLSVAEAQEAHAAFQSALGLDSLTRNTAATPAAVPNVPAAFVQRSTAELIEACNAFIESMRSGSAPWLMTRLNDTYGPMPSVADAAAFGYWVALVMPIDEHEKAKLLPIRSARLRLCIVVHWIEQLRQTWWFNHGCSVQ